MTIAPNPTPLAAHPAVVADTTSLLPAREAVLVRLAEQMHTTDDTPATLIVLGLLRRDDGRPVPRPIPAEVTALLARSLRVTTGWPGLATLTPDLSAGEAPRHREPDRRPAGRSGHGRAAPAALLTTAQPASKDDLTFGSVICAERNSAYPSGAGLGEYPFQEPRRSRARP